MNVATSARRAIALLALALIACVAASCASPPLTLYTLGAPAAASDAVPLEQKSVVIEIRRVSVPEYLDSQDLLVRDGNTLVRSTQGRWGTRVSTSATYFLTNALAQRRPDALVTDQPPVDPPTFRIYVTIGTLDVTAAGTATLDADWLIVPRNPAQPTRRERGRFTGTGPVATDQDIVSLYAAVLRQLANAINVTSLH